MAFTERSPGISAGRQNDARQRTDRFGNDDKSMC
jgi:hypothetical protein